MSIFQTLLTAYQSQLASSTMVQNSDIQLFIDDYNNDPNPSLNRETQQNGLIMYFAIQKISKKMMITLSPNSNYQK